jgi:hypothetical protein|tara:strand:+ start:4489 stop:4620 length:132 start_codon:yes stop_codon:yes gene_type:complete
MKRKPSFLRGVWQGIAIALAVAWAVMALLMPVSATLYFLTHLG